MGGNVARTGKMKITHTILVGKPGMKRPHGRPRCWGDNIRMDLREIEWEGVECATEFGLLWEQYN